VPTVALQRQGGQVQADRPPLRVTDELRQLRVVQLDTGTREQQARLRLIHRQIVDPDFDGSAPSAKSARRERRCTPGRDHQVRRRGKVNCELRDGVAALGVVEELRMVEKEGDRAHRRQRGRDTTGDDRGDRRARGSPGAKDVHVDRLEPVQCGGEVRQEDRGVVVLPLDGKPGHAVRCLVGPLTQQRRLAVARRSDDRHHRHVGRCAQPIQQGGPTHRSRAR
jgi:hypothetical protein